MPENHNILKRQAIDFVLPSSNSLMKFCFAVVLIGLLICPRLEINSSLSAKLRLEDVAGLFLFFIVCYRCYSDKIKIDIVIPFPIVYFLYIVFISVSRFIFNESSVNFLFFFGKEFQYYIFFIVAYSLFLNDDYKMLRNVFFACIFVQVAWGCYQILCHAKVYYGIAALFFKDSPSLSAHIYFFGALFIQIYMYSRPMRPGKITNLLIFIKWLSALCCVATISRSSILGIVAFFISFYFLNDIFYGKKRNTIAHIISKNLKWLLILLLSGLFVYLFLTSLDKSVFGYMEGLSRVTNPLGSISARIGDWGVRLERTMKYPIDYLIGKGYGGGMYDPEMHKMYFGMAYDSLYVRNIIDFGFFGTGIWAIMLFLFGWTLRKNRHLLICYVALLVSYLAMGIGVESMLLSKSGAAFWILTGMLLGINRRVYSCEPCTSRQRFNRGRRHSSFIRASSIPGNSPV